MATFDATSLSSECEKKIDANFDGSKKKKPQDIDASSLQKIKDIDHLAKKEIPHGKGAANPQKIMGLAWGPAEGDNRMAVCDQLGTLFVWDTIKVVRMYGLQYPFAQCIALNPDVNNPMILAGGMRNATTLYKKEPGSPKMKETKTWVAHDGYISSVAFLADPSKYISSSGDADIRLFDIQGGVGTEKGYLKMSGHDKDCQSIKFARDDKAKNTFITCSSDKTVKMWDIRAAMCTHTFPTDSELNACALFPNGNLIAAGGEKDKTYVMDVRAYKQVGKYARNNMKTASVEFSKSGRELYVGHDDGAIVVWDIFGSGENKMYAKKIEAHTTKDRDGKVQQQNSRVQVLDVGPEGFLASGGFDGSVKIWGAPAA
jgi:WD40 repeat protein